MDCALSVTENPCLPQAHEDFLLFFLLNILLLFIKFCQNNTKYHKSILISYIDALLDYKQKMNISASLLSLPTSLLF